MELETVIPDLDLRSEEIGEVLELRHNIIHCDAGFIIRRPNAETVTRYLCWWLEEASNN